MLERMRIFLCLLLAAVFLAAPRVSAAPPIPVILDTDIGDDIDDALALALALQSPELNVRGIVTVLNQGERRADLVWRILELYGRTDIAVGVGAEQPLLAKGLTGVVRQTRALAAEYRMPPDKRRIGLQLFIDTCLQSPEKITILAYGPLTNVALALRAEPRIKDHISRIVLMNGVFFRAGLEYNTKIDPEAAEIVYNSGLPVATVGLDVTLQCRLSAEQLQRVADSKLASVKFLYELIQIWQNGNAATRPILHDPLAVLIAVKPELVSMVNGRVTVETRGTPEETYGMSVLHRDPAGKVQVAQEVSSAAAIDLFLERILAAPRSAAK
jgi:inosine-uridine nucleoside N-ribohydrolase